MLSIKKNIILLLLFIGYNLGYSQANLTVGESIYEDENRIGTENNKEENQILERPNQNNDRSLMAGPILYDQSELVNYPGQGFGGANASGTTGLLFGLNANISGNFTVADDFTVPISELWTIDSIVVFCYQTNSGTTSSIDSIKMQVRQGNTPGTGTVVFGDMTNNRLANTYFSGIYRTRPTSLTNTQRPIMKATVNLNGTSFTSGNYLIEYIFGGNSMLAGPFALLRTLGTTHIATGNAFQFSSSSWVNVLETDASSNNPLPKGLTFIIYGTSVEDNAARINGVNYYTLQDAINAAVNDGDEITLLKNINETTVNVGLNNKSVAVKADGYTCTIDQLNISNGEYLRWIEDNLAVTGGINNTTGTLWNNAIIIIPNFTNTGIYKGNGTLIGNMNNQHSIVPGN